MIMGKKRTEEDDDQGAPEWMVTFSDCMTLLLTFFVLLLSFSTFDPRTLSSLATSFALSMPAVGLSTISELDSMREKQQSKTLEKITKGSETKTVAQSDTNNFMREKKPLDFKNLKVFTIPSKRVFLGKGSVLSQDGKQMCDSFVSFLKRMPSRIVISENGGSFNKDIGLSRSLAILEYMKNEGIREGRFNITSQTMMKNSLNDQRYVEITLLEKNIYE